MAMQNIMGLLLRFSEKIKAAAVLDTVTPTHVRVEHFITGAESNIQLQMCIVTAVGGGYERKH